MSRTARHSQPSRRARSANIEISTLAKWVILLVFLFVVMIALIKMRGAGDASVNSLCERTAGLMGC